MADISLNSSSASLDISSSLSGRRWRLREADERMAQAIMQQQSVPYLAARLLAARGVMPEQAERFLLPSLRDWLPDPSTLKDMDAAAERVAAAVMSGETIGIFGDYDVDGATSSALLVRFCRALNMGCEVHIPDRMREGYGPNTDAMLGLKARGCSVIITVDCGTVAFEPITAAHEAGVDVIVVDHHMGAPELPKAYAVVNPNRLDETDVVDGLRSLCAAGMVFLLLVAVMRELRRHGWFDNRPAPDLLQWLDLVALGTVCDVVSLTGLNRAFVAQGLKVMARRGNSGLAALADVAGIEEAPSVYTAGFVFGPRINAGGRVGEAPLGMRLLSTDDPLEAAEIARRLNQHNAERQAIEAAVLDEAMMQAEAMQELPCLMVQGTGWHEGVIGIVAGRLKEWFHKPVAVVTVNKQGVAKASARSIPGVDIGAAVGAAREAGLLLAGGGHAMAAGFSVAVEGIDALQAFLNERLTQAVETHGGAPVIKLDGIVAPSGVTVELVEKLEQAGPYGMGHPAPRIAVQGCRIIQAEPVGSNHLRLLVTEQDAGGYAGASRLKAMAFRSMDTEWGQRLQSMVGQNVHLAGQLKINRWMGRASAEMTVEDAAAADR